MIFHCVAVLLAALLAAVPSNAQEFPETVKNPFTSPAEVVAGGLLYRSHCAVCHGIDGEGGRGADLTTGLYRYGSSDAELYHTISEGIPGTEMPAIFFNGRQLWQLVAFVRSLSQGRAAEQVRGDPANGREIFLAMGCSGCHRVQGEGGRMGPDLSDVGALRSLGHLQSSILQPNESVSAQHWVVRAETTNGEKISGMRLNEDTFSVQLIDANGNLRSLKKKQLAEFRVDRSSAMPSYEGKIEGSDFDDLVAYLASLRVRQASNEAQ